MVKTSKPDYDPSPLYTPANFYMLRTPVLSTNLYKQITSYMAEGIPDDQEKYEAFLNNARQHSYNIIKQLVALPEIEQAIAVASTSLLEGLKELQNKASSPVRLEHTYAHILRYLIRMSTRPTPFGLFSGVVIGSFGESTTAQLATPIVRYTRTRPDMGWLFSLIQKIEQNKDFVSQLFVVINHTIYVTGERVIIPYSDVYGQGSKNSITLRCTPVIRFMIDIASQPIPYHELRSRLIQKFSNATEGQIDGLLDQLWEHHFLISDLRPPLIAHVPAAYILEKMKAVKDAGYICNTIEEVLMISSKLDEGNRKDKSELISHLIQLQKQLAPEKQKHFFQVDTALHLEAPLLNTSIGVAAAQAVEILLRLGCFPEGPHHLREYHAAFLERYGVDSEVPLLDLLSPETGLDAPSTYTEPPRSYPLPPVQEATQHHRDNLLWSIAMEATNAGAIEVEMTDHLMKELTYWDPNKDTLPPPSLEIYAQIQATSKEALDQGNWRFIVAPGLAMSGRTFCRFFDVLDSDGLRMLQEYIRREEEFQPDMIFAELSYLPTMGRVANVAVRPMLRKYEIVVNTTPSAPSDKVIPLHDLVVGAYSNRLYIRSLRLGKEVIACQGHMLNPRFAPNVCRFLLEVAGSVYPTPGLFYWGTASNAPFLPRLVRENIVLSPAQWNIHASTITPLGSGSDEVRWFAGLQRWRKLWHVPRYVYLVNADMRLLLDLEHPLTVADLYREVRKVNGSGVIRLQEMLPDFTHLWLQDNKGAPYVAELVIPLSLAKEKIVYKDSKSMYPKRVIQETERRQLPGGEWAFLKLYAATHLHDEIIAGPLRALVEKMGEQGLMDCWFFVRYLDPEPHLRIRFHAVSPQFNEEVLKIPLAWSQELTKRGLVYRITVDTYYREVERYGGIKAIELLEAAFTFDSITVSDIIASLYTRHITLEPLVVAVFSLDRLFTIWGLDPQERLNYIQKHTKKYQGGDLFHKWQKLLRELLSPWDAAYNPEIKRQREQLSSILTTQENLLKKVSKQIRIDAAKGELWQSEEDILTSLAHMHLNRLLGTNREQEHLVYGCWRQTLESILRRPATKSEKVSGRYHD